MAKSASHPAASYWKSDWFAGVAVMIAVIVLHLATDVIGTLERRFYDFASNHNTRPPSSQLAVIAIDAQSIASIGRWPWPGDIHVRLIEQLVAGKARAIVLTDLALAPDPDYALRFIRKLKAALASSEDSANPSPATHAQLTEMVAEAEAALDTDARLATILKNAGNVIILNAAGGGQLNLLPDPDGIVRRVPLLPQFYPARAGQPAFAVDSFDDVLTGTLPASRYADKIVVIGVTAAGLAKPLAVPGHPALSPAEAIAHITSSVLNEHLFVRPGWGLSATLAMLLLVGAYLITLLPRLSARTGAMLSLLLLVALLGAEFALLAGAALWLEMVLPATLLLIGHLAILSKRRWVTVAVVPPPKADQAAPETDRMMGLALQGQGQLDMAFARLRRVPMSEALMADLYALALDFERKHQSSQAEAVYQHMATYNQDYKDIRAKLNPLTTPAEPAQTGILGRYQVVRELGKGAMGVVYLGKDPKIGRLVAIKTMALSEEFEGRALDDARDRFFREAETAGRLQHPYIVTIFDADEDHGLAYIAMEFLKGQDLTKFCKTGQLLPVATVLGIAARVAEALCYAHQQHVVHRDIKPANIMLDLASDTVKVTDFGIARITDSSRTRTGLVLGTPSFMSPEQLAGRKVDGRTDLYSLGVMLFQLLTGVLPFRADSMAALMHKIANDDAPDIRTLRPELPPGLASLVAMSLRKRTEDRYQDGGQFARDLRAVLSGGNAIDLEI